MFKKGDVVKALKRIGAIPEGNIVTFLADAVLVGKTFLGQIDWNGMKTHVMFDASYFESYVIDNRYLEVGDVVYIASLEELEANEFATEYMGKEVKNPFLAQGMKELAGRKATVLRAGGRLKGCKDLSIEGSDVVYTWHPTWFVAGAVVGNKTLYVAGDELFVIGHNGEKDLVPRWTEAKTKKIGKKEIVVELKKEYVITKSGNAYRLNQVRKWKTSDNKMDIRKQIAVARKKSATGLCAFTFVSSDGKIVHKDDAPCHAALARARDTAAMIEHLKHHEGKVNKGAWVKWVDYITHRSPWAIAFKQKQTRAIMSSGLDVNIEAHPDVVAAGLIALRTGHEYKFANEFVQLLALGMSEHAAYILSFMYQFDKKGKPLTGRRPSGHTVLNHTIHMDNLLSFFKNGYNKEWSIPTKKFKDGGGYKVTGPINDTTTDLDFDKKEFGIKMIEYIDQVSEAKVVGNGWTQTVKVSKEGIIKAGKHIDELIGA